MNETISTVGITIPEGEKFSSGIGYIALPKDIDRIDYLKDCYITALLTAMTPFTMAQMIDMAIMTLQVMGLYSQTLTEWKPYLPRPNHGTS